MGAIINTEEISASQVNSQPAWSDYFELCKPRVVALMLICAAVGMALASSNIPSPELIISTLIGVALVAGSAAVVNHIADARIDALMARTQNRPIATLSLIHI